MTHGYATEGEGIGPDAMGLDLAGILGVDVDGFEF